MKFWCVGCGRLLWNGEVGRAGLAISCLPCGATAPVLRDDQGRFVWPASFYQGGGHIEYYVGWSSYEDRFKTSAIETLVANGAVRAEECKDASCRRIHEQQGKRLLAALKESPEDLRFFTRGELCMRFQMREPQLATLFAAHHLDLPPAGLP